jgi:hypothetical protein
MTLLFMVLRKGPEALRYGAEPGVYLYSQVCCAVTCPWVSPGGNTGQGSNPERLPGIKGGP